MPELPEVETTKLGIVPHIHHNVVDKVIIRHPRLRWPIPKNLDATLKNQRVNNILRRGKYILINFPKGTLLIHLGMSGRLKILSENIPPQKHDHVDILFTNHKILRFTDPRRFGAILWTSDNPCEHVLLKNLGPEPLSAKFSGNFLFQKTRNSKIAAKKFLMDSKNVVGVGNIYAAEALFLAGIHPELSVNQLTLVQCNKLVTAIKKVLKMAIKKGGTTLKDFSNSNGEPGYFSLKLKVYGRQKLPCFKCKTILENRRLGQRATVFCPKCQAFKKY